jgi:hypothetical protein
MVPGSRRGVGSGPVAGGHGAGLRSRDRLRAGMVEVMSRNFAAEGLDTRAEVMDGQALDLEDEARADRRGDASLTEPPLEGWHQGAPRSTAVASRSPG